MTEYKKFSTGVLVWIFFGGIGGHRIYVEERFHYLFWYWAFSLITFGIAPIVGLFRLRKRILAKNIEMDRQRKEFD